MAKVYANANSAAAHHVETHRAVRQVRAMVEVKARTNLAEANSTTRVTLKGYFPAEIETEDGATDYYVVLHAPNAMALEFGHAPSGVFEGTDTRPPAAEYILTKAAIGGSTIA